MKNINTYYIALIFSALFVVSCSDDEDATVEYGKGLYIVNQGNFGTGIGTVDYISTESDTVDADIFMDANLGLQLGNVVQSMITFDDKIFIAVNNAAKIEVVDSKTFKSVGIVTGIPQPRYFATDGDQLYVSSWGLTGLDGAVYEIDTDNYTVKSTIDLGSGPEDLHIVGDKLIVARGGGFGTDSTLVVIDMNTNEIESTIEVAYNPNFIDEDADGNLYVVCGGFTSFTDPTLNTNGELIKLTDLQVVSSIEVENGAIYCEYHESSNSILYYAGGSVWAQAANEATRTMNRIYTGFIYALEVANNEVYLSDPKDFASKGTVHKMSENFDPLNSYEVGIIPGFIYLVD